MRKWKIKFGAMIVLLVVMFTCFHCGSVDVENLCEEEFNGVKGDEDPNCNASGSGS